MVNSEISLGTITSRRTAQEWLKGFVQYETFCGGIRPGSYPTRTFLFIRIQQNPSFYSRILKHLGGKQLTWEEWLEKFVDVRCPSRFPRHNVDAKQKALEELLDIELIQYIKKTDVDEEDDEPEEDHADAPIGSTESVYNLNRGANKAYRLKARADRVWLLHLYVFQYRRWASNKIDTSSHWHGMRFGKVGW